MRILTTLLIASLLLLAACSDNDDAMAPSAPEAATAEEMAATPMTPADEMEDTEIITDAEGLTELDIMTDTAEMSDTQGMSDTESMAGTAEMTGTESMTGTASMTTTGSMEMSTATATLMDSDGNTVGNATFTETAEGVTIEVTLSGFTAAAEGEHGIHIHTTGACTPDFQAAGGHFNPTGAQHGLDNPEGPHAGDLPNMEVDADGNASYQTTDTMITLGDGEGSLFDEDGSALVIHAGPDDMVTDPAGDSGDRIACGVIEMQTE